MKVLIIIGTARKGRKSVYAAEKALKAFKSRSHDAEIFDIKEEEFPRYLGNRTYVNDEEPVPDGAKKLSDRVEASDLIVLATPEYNHSFPGALKTAMDHLYPEYDDKVFGFITVSAGGFGGVRCLGHLHDYVNALGGFAGPELTVSDIGSKFNEEGELIDESENERFYRFVEDCEKFREKMREGL
ncbi:MAG: NADPH-dependent FMN reductase [Candidatus Nanohalobium sp.]